MGELIFHGSFITSGQSLFLCEASLATDLNSVLNETYSLPFGWSPRKFRMPGLKLPFRSFSPK